MFCSSVPSSDKSKKEAVTPEHVLPLCPLFRQKQERSSDHRACSTVLTPSSEKQEGSSGPMEQRTLQEQRWGDDHGRASQDDNLHANRRTDHVRQNPAGKRRMRTMKEPSGNLTALIDFRPGGTDSNSTQEKGPASRTKRQWPCLATEIALLWKRHPRYLGGYNGKKARPHCKHVTP